MMAFSRATTILLLVSFMVSAIVPASMADDGDAALVHENYVRYNNEQPKSYPPCTECYSNCTKTWRPHTCHFKCFWCTPLSETISGDPPSNGLQSFIQGTRSSVGFVVDTIDGAINGTKGLIHTVF